MKNPSFRVIDFGRTQLWQKHLEKEIKRLVKAGKKREDIDTGTGQNSSIWRSYESEMTQEMWEARTELLFEQLESI